MKTKAIVGASESQQAGTQHSHPLCDVESKGRLFEMGVDDEIVFFNERKRLNIISITDYGSKNFG